MQPFMWSCNSNGNKNKYSNLALITNQANDKTSTLSFAMPDCLTLLHEGGRKKILLGLYNAA